MLHKFFIKMLHKGKTTDCDANVMTYYNQALDFYEQEKFNEAIAAFDKVIELDPTNKDAYNYRGLAFYSEGKFNKAIPDLKKAIKLDPKDTTAYVHLGLIFSDKGRFKKALANYNQAIKLDPEDADAYNNLAIVFYAQGKFSEAITNYNKVIELEPEDTTAYYNRGMAFSYLWRVKEAIADFNKVIELDPHDKVAHCNLKRARQAYEFLKTLAMKDNEDKRVEFVKEKKPNISTDIDLLLRRARRLNELMRKHKLSFDQAENYSIAAANIWLFQGQQLIDVKIPAEIYLHITSYVLGEIEAEKIINVANMRIFINSIDDNFSKFKLSLFTTNTTKYLEKMDEYLEKQEQIKERCQSRLIR